ncbi:CDP-diacylglycerol--glycerol-3-phosphate 3-phosphatidyltransferase [Ascosphaera acerosa]|nr:CDP-diacylglycerol--glycerol-3-phosphate 3-phosphatidyltransferase [Ascosphaera acerosa]
MLARRLGCCAWRCGSRAAPARSSHIRRPTSAARYRRFASQASSAAQAPFAAAASAAGALGAITVTLDQIAPKFEVSARQIEIIDSPAAFYETLKTKILGAKHRVYLSTLYIGCAEHELVSVIDTALQRNPDLQVSILTDALRGTREAPGPSCASLLAGLVAKHGQRVDIRMYHTPNFRGLKKRLVPKRVNEGWGLQHMKLYGVDDEILLSGANLSNDYFTNRVDRYHLFRSQQLADYYHQIHQAVCSLSFTILPDPRSPAGYTMVWRNAAPHPLDDTEAFKSHAAAVLKPLIGPVAQKHSQPPRRGDHAAPGDGSVTYVYPISQFTPLIGRSQSTEYSAVTSVLAALADYPQLASSRWLFTAGYFNMHPTVSSLLISSAAAADAKANAVADIEARHAAPPPTCTVLTASPWANGFYGSKGISGMLPAAYTHISTKFLARVAAAGRGNSIRLMEWRRGTVGQPGGWTYHAKGLWVTLPGESDPSLTIVGSSNYTKRSYNLDIETGAVVVTSDEGLKRRLGEEAGRLQTYAWVTTREDLEAPERRAAWYNQH